MIQIVYDAQFIAWLLNKHRNIYDKCIKSQTFESITPEMILEYAKDKGLIKAEDKEGY